jgi:membrane-bound lytic murein transglycosylase MltF
MLRISSSLAIIGFILTATSWAQDSILPGETYTDDLDGMLERRVIRVLTVYNPMLYFLDGATPRGIVHEAMQEFDKYINEKYKLGTRKLNVVIIPVPRDQLLPRLTSGQGDIAIANLTITQQRLETVDFSIPSYTGVSEQLVTGPEAPQINSIDDLSGQTIHIRKSSSYFESLTRMNADFESRGMAPIIIEPADEYLEDADLLELVNAGLIPMIVVDSHKADFWKEIFQEIVIRPDITFREGGEIAWAIRKGSPNLMSDSNEFLKTIKKGTLLGNILLKRYLKENKWIKNPTTREEMEKFYSTVEMFTRYSEQYNFDWLMMVALGYQESRLDHSVRSKAGAIGIMQVLESTAKDPNVDIHSIEEIENNIHAGTKYLRFLRDRYFTDDEIDALNQTLFSFASYNAGPAKVRKLREKARERGLDPNVWFGNVEVICAEVIGRETTQYVGNIYKYYIAYTFAVAKMQKKKQAIEEIESG